VRRRRLTQQHSRCLGPPPNPPHGRSVTLGPSSTKIGCGRDCSLPERTTQVRPSPRSALLTLVSGGLAAALAIAGFSTVATAATDKASAKTTAKASTTTTTAKATLTTIPPSSNRRGLLPQVQRRQERTRVLLRQSHRSGPGPGTHACAAPSDDQPAQSHHGSADAAACGPAEPGAIPDRLSRTVLKPHRGSTRVVTRSERPRSDHALIALAGSIASGISRSFG
jgi:hypothetical protein